MLIGVLAWISFLFFQGVEVEALATEAPTLQEPTADAPGITFKRVA